MQGLIDCGKYKVTEVLSSHSGFEAALCSDVTVNDGTVYIVNEYSSMVYIRELLQLFCAMEKQRFRGFRGLITSSGSFSAVFVYRSGVPFAWKQKVIWCESLTPMINAASFCLLRKRRKN